MKKLFTTSVLMMAVALSGIAATISIGVSGTTFTNNNATAEVGDVLSFTISSPHTATQVSQSTWNANGSTSNGGFNFSGNGTFTYTLTSADIGTIYYVCQPHASMGMKGQVTVTTATPVLGKVSFEEITAYPNPTSGMITLDNSEPVEVKVYDQYGTLVKDVYIDKNGQLNLADLRNGVYYISVMNENKREKSGRIVKQ